MTRLRCEPLEDRVTPAVTASQIGGVVTVTLEAAGDIAIVTGTSPGGTNITVSANGAVPAPNTFTNVTGLVVEEAGGAQVAAGQGVVFSNSGGGARLDLGAGAITVTNVEWVDFQGTTEADGGLTVTGAQLVTGAGHLPVHFRTIGAISLGVGAFAGDSVGTADKPLSFAAGSYTAVTPVGANHYVYFVGGGTTTVTGVINLGTGRLVAGADGLGGTLLVDGTVNDSGADPDVIAGPNAGVGTGVLGGSGTIAGGVLVRDRAVLAPGSSTAIGTLSTGRLSFETAGQFRVKVGGAGGGQADAVVVTGEVRLLGARFTLVPLGAAPAVGAVLTVIDNDGADSVVGSFEGVPEGGLVSDGLGNAYTLSYFGGTGNDVTLTRVGPAGTAPTSPLLVTGTSSFAQLHRAVGGQYRLAAGLWFVPGFDAELHGAVGDVTGEGVPDFVVGTGPGPGASRVVVLDGTSAAAGARTVLADFVVFPGYTGGVFVAVGDLTGDGFADVIVTPDAADAFSGPESNQLPVKVYDGAALRTGTLTLVAAFDGLASLDGTSGQGNPAVKLGGRPAVADVNGDGRNDLLIAAGTGGGPRVTVWNGTGFPGANGGKPTTNPIANLFVFESTQRGGAFVAGGDVTGDGRAEVVVGGGPGGGARVRVVDGAKLLALPSLEAVNLDDPGNLSNGLVLNNFFAGSDASRGGVRVAVKDADADGRADVVTGSGAGERSAVRVYRAVSLAAAFGTSAEPAGAQVLDPYGAVVAGGVWVG